MVFFLTAFLSADHWNSKMVPTELERACKNLVRSKYCTFDSESKASGTTLGPQQRLTIVNGLLFPVSIKTDCEYNVHVSGLKLPEALVHTHMPVKTGGKKKG